MRRTIFGLGILSSVVMLILLCLIPITMAGGPCNNSLTQYVPAVVGTGGELIKVSFRLVPGTGIAYLSAYPNSGVMTQQSVEQAVNSAYLVSNRSKDCDLIITFDPSGSANFVDGPSAGAAMAVASYALLTNRSIRNDTIMTGTIEPTNSIGQVGGLYEKANGAVDSGAKYFLMPQTTIYNSLLLENLGKQRNITIIQVRNINDAINFLINNVTINQTALGTIIPISANIKAYDDSGVSNFIPVAQDMIRQEQDSLISLPANSNDANIDMVKKFFSNEINRSDYELGKGYVFTAANDAFLDYIELSTINTILNSRLDLTETRTSVQRCLDNTHVPAITSNNMDWAIGVDLRKSWAYDKLNNSALNATNQLTEDKYAQYNGLMYAQNWCRVANSMINNAPSGGTPINEESWKQIASDSLAQADALAATNPDLVSRLLIAHGSYNAGHYGAAIYDAVYVYEMDSADKDIANDSTISIDNRVKGLLNETRTSLWGQLYQSQGAFLYQQGDQNTAYNILGYAKALDKADSLMRSKINVESMPNQTNKILPLKAKNNDIPFVFMIAIIVLGILLYMRWRGENGNNVSRSRKTYRAK